MKEITKNQLILVLGFLVAIVFLLYNIFATSLQTKKQADPTVVEFDTFTTNLQGGEFNYLKMDLSLKMPNKTQKNRLLSNKPQARRTILNLATMQDGRELLSLRGKENFKGQIGQKIEKDFGVRVENVYFTNFVLAD